MWHSKYSAMQPPCLLLFLAIFLVFMVLLLYKALMKTLEEIGAMVAIRRQQLGLKQREVAEFSGVPVSSLNRFERGHLTEFGTRKLLSVLTVLDMELNLTQRGFSGSLDELRKERANA